MKTQVWYSVDNCGDGSAYPKWMESEELAEIHQRFMWEGWGEPCIGCLTIESDSPIKILDHIETVNDMITETLEILGYTNMKEYRIALEEKLKCLYELRERKTI